MICKKFVAGETAGTYQVTVPVTAEDILAMASQLSKRRLAKGRKIEKPSSAFKYLQALMRDHEYEVFGVVFLDTRHKVIKFEELFRGTVDAASVYPREIVKRALELNTSAVLLVHNHPSGDPEPSNADKVITEHIKDALNLVDIRTLDHVVVGTEGCVSLAERGVL